MATRIDDSLEPGLAEVAEAFRRFSADQPVASREGLARAHAATLAAVRAQSTRRKDVADRVRQLPSARSRVIGFALAAAAAIALALAVQPAWITQPVQAALGLSGGGSTVKSEARLASTSTDDALASGKAKAEARSDRTRLSVEVEDMASPPGSYEVRLLRDGTPVAGSAGLTISVDALGDGDLNLDSRDGDHVPPVQAGDVIEVVNGAGVALLRGTLAAK